MAFPWRKRDYIRRMLQTLGLSDSQLSQANIRRDHETTDKRSIVWEASASVTHSNIRTPVPIPCRVSLVRCSLVRSGCFYRRSKVLPSFHPQRDKAQAVPI